MLAHILYKCNADGFESNFIVDGYAFVTCQEDREQKVCNDVAEKGHPEVKLLGYLGSIASKCRCKVVARYIQ